MSTTVLEALQNADFNLQTVAVGSISFILAKAQLHNAVVLLDKGYDLEDELSTIIDNYYSVEDVPEK